MSEQDQSIAAATNAAVAAATAASHGERLAVVETEIKGVRKEVGFVRADVTEVRSDVKTLLASDNRFQGGTSLISKAAPWVALAVAIAAAVKGS